MNKTLRFITFFLLIAISANAQRMNKEKMKLLKTSYITDALDLTPQEAEKFWPIYNLYTDKIEKARFSNEFEIRKEIKEAGGIDSVSEKQAETYVSKMMIVEKEIYKNKIALYENLAKAISAKKIFKLQKAEKDFNKRILQEYGRRKNHK